MVAQEGRNKEKEDVCKVQITAEQMSYIAIYTVKPAIQCSNQAAQAKENTKEEKLFRLASDLRVTVPD